MAFSETFLEELAARSDIADVVGSYVHLTKRTGANQFGLCPFHSEKTPSFSVNTERQIYHCFGCGKGGSVINFIMEIENLSFPDAVQFLARRAGMEVPDERPDENRGRRSRMLELNRDAARFFHACLRADTGAAAAYVKKRGIAPALVKSFGLGFAPNSWNALTDAMMQRGYTRAELMDAGLARAGKSGGVYDYFRNRLMFPVIDVRGSVIGFSGRILDDGEPKYLNSPDTLVYSKAHSLFALNLAKKSKSGYIILAEGNIDVVSLHQAGFDSAVASLGTSLTPDQARLLARYTNQIVIAYDSDAAGQKAAQRAIGILQPLDIKVKVLRIPGAKDPDELIRSQGPDAFRRLIERSDNQIEYRLQLVQEKYDLSADEGRVGYLKEAAALIASLPGSVEREIYGARCAERAGVSAQAFMLEVGRVRKRLTGAARKQRDREELAVSRRAQPKERSLRFDNLKSAVAEQGVINLLCRFPELFSDAPIEGAAFSSPVLGRLYDAIAARVRAGRSVSVAALEGVFAPEELTLLADILKTDPVKAAQAPEALRDYINTIQSEHEKLGGMADLNSYAEKLKRTKGYGGKNGNEKERP